MWYTPGLSVTMGIGRGARARRADTRENARSGQLVASGAPYPRTVRKWRGVKILDADYGKVTAFGLRVLGQHDAED